MARRLLPPDLTDAQLRDLGILPPKPTRQAPCEEYLLARHSGLHAPVREASSRLSDVSCVLDEHDLDVVGFEPADLSYMEKADRPDAYRPLPPRAEGRSVQTRLRGGVPGPMARLTDWEVSRSNRHRDDLPTARPVTDADRDEAEEAGLYRNLDLEWGKPASAPKRTPARKREAPTPSLPSLETWEHETQRLLDSLTARFGVTGSCL